MHSLEPSADQALGVEDGISWVHGSLVFSGIADQAFFGGKGDIGWCCAVPLCRGVSAVSAGRKGGADGHWR